MFTPVESSIGGLLIGTSVAAFLYLNGRITGISGIVSVFYDKTIKKSNDDPMDYGVRGLYLVGLLLGGLILNFLLSPESFLGNYPEYSSTLTSISTNIVAGLLVAVGTYLGSGCTSGHMICGIARLSLRSFVATATFCGVAFSMVKLFGTAETTNAVFPTEPFMVLPTTDRTLLLLGILAAVWLTYTVLIFNVHQFRPNGNHNMAMEYFTSFFCGLVFALGLGISGMTLPGKVLGFFDVGGRRFDPSLVCVALFAIFADMVLFQTYLLALPKKQKPLYSYEWRLPQANTIDTKLIVGAVLFGLGWGLNGICPGPAIVSIADFRLDIVAFCIAYIAGLSVVKQVDL